MYRSGRWRSEGRASTMRPMDQDTTVLEAQGTEDADVDEELLIEEISIDGMCGVY